MRDESILPLAWHKNSSFSFKTTPEKKRERRRKNTQRCNTKIKVSLYRNTHSCSRIKVTQCAHSRRAKKVSKSLAKFFTVSNAYSHSPLSFETYKSTECEREKMFLPIPRRTAARAKEKKLKNHKSAVRGERERGKSCCTHTMVCGKIHECFLHIALTKCSHASTLLPPPPPRVCFAVSLSRSHEELSIHFALLFCLLPCNCVSERAKKRERGEERKS